MTDHKNIFHGVSGPQGPYDARSIGVTPGELASKFSSTLDGLKNQPVVAVELNKGFTLD